MKNRIYLRALELEDYKVSVAWRNDDDIINMVGGAKHYVSSEKEREWVLNAIKDNSSKIVLAICLKNNNKYIGNVMLQDIDWINRSGHVPVLIGDKSEWNNGYATEARILMLKFAFYERGLERIYSEVLEDNINSIEMNKKCGFIVEGVARKAVYKNGRFHNVVLMSLLREEFDEVYQKYCARFKD